MPEVFSTLHHLDKAEKRSIKATAKEKTMGGKTPAMVVPSINPIPRGLTNRKKTVAAASLGVTCLVIPVLIIVLDPIFILAKFKLRVTKGSMLHEMMMKETEAARLEVYVFNVSNAERFLNGQDQKLRMQEVGPFVYQEYRTHEDIEFDQDAGVVRFIPRFRAEFIEEESVGRPEETILAAPNVPYLSITSYFSTMPTVVQSMYKLWLWQLFPKPIRSLDVHKSLWGYRDNILDVYKTLAPGLLYYDSMAFFDTLYDKNADYKLEMDITNKKKFQVKTVMKKLREKSWNSSDLVETKFEFQDTYEGAAFPPQMDPHMPLNFYRPGVCKTLGWEYTGRKRIKLGPDAFVYQLSNKTFENTRLCDSKGLCPQGVLDLSSCYYGVPIAVTKTHLLDVDPAFQKRVDGLNPDREKYPSYFLVEPKIGLTVDSSLSLQLNLLLGDMRFMPDLAKFSDMLLPLVHAKMTLPELPDATKNSLSLLYVTGPQILLSLEIVSWIIGFILIGYSIKLTYPDWFRSNRDQRNFNSKLEGKVSAELPLIS